jgi:hypothetical protein
MHADLSRIGHLFDTDDEMHFGDLRQNHPSSRSGVWMNGALANPRKLHTKCFRSIKTLKNNN